MLPVEYVTVLIRFSAGTFEKVPTKIFYSKNTFPGFTVQGSTSKLGP